MPTTLPEGHAQSEDPWWDTPPPEPGTKTSHRRRRAWWPLIALALLATAAGALSMRANQRTHSGYLVAPGTLSTVAPDQRIPGPLLRGELLDRSPFDSSDWAGHIVVVNFWGSWCPPCVAETPGLTTVATANYDSGVRFLGVDVRDDRASATAFTRRYHVPYPSLFDPSGQQALAFRGLPPNAVPTTFVIDRRGRIAARALGRINANQLTAVITTLRQEDPQKLGPVQNPS